MTMLRASARSVRSGRPVMPAGMLLCALACAAPHGARAGNGGAELTAITPRQAVLKCARYETVTVDIAVEGGIDNPYDPDEVSIDAIVTAPSGRELVVPAFYWEGFERALVSGEEQLTPTGESGWRARFTPASSRPRRRVKACRGASSKSPAPCFPPCPRSCSP